jgi:hypothetical protein
MEEPNTVRRELDARKLKPEKGSLVPRVRGGRADAL